MRAARVVAFDCWIANDDRPARNLAYARELVPFAMFDHGHALLGPDEQGGARLVRRRNEPAVAGCLHPVLTEAGHLHDMAQEIASIPRRRIDEICDAVRQAGAMGQDLIVPLADFLEHRKTRILELLEASAQDFPLITQWSLT